MSTRYRILSGPVRQFLKERKLEQQDLAARIDVTPYQLSRILRGRVPLTFEMGTRIANGLYVPLDAVMEPIEPAAVEADDAEQQAVGT
jgi:transcriptional regulator with XRE-family HTH domain